MKIAIDCADLDHVRIDGTRVYIKNLLRWMGKLSSEDEFLLYHQKEFNPLLAPPKFSNYQELKIPYPWWWTQTRLAYELKKSQPDVCWMPIQQIPFIGPQKIKYVVTIHDLAFKFFPYHFPLADRLKINFFTDTAIKRADKIIAVSHSTKRDILKFYPKIKSGKIAVVHHGFEKRIFEQNYSQEAVNQLLKKYNIARQDYLLYVGAIQPRKNLITLVKAFEKIKKVKKELQLVLVGEEAWKAKKTMKAIKDSPYKQDIILTGKVNFKDLGKFYQGAGIFVFPSLYEGFGIPLLEAFASGTPVVTTGNSSLKEVGGKGAKYFKDRDSQELASLLQEVLENSIMRKEMVAEGLKQCRKFSWEKCARETLKILKETVSNSQKKIIDFK